MTGVRRGPQRVRMPYVEWLMEMLSERDWAIVVTVGRVRVATGLQLERLHFSELAGQSRSVMRWRVLKRLTDLRVLTTYERRVGGSLSGSAELRFVLDTAGQQLIRLQPNRELDGRQVRRPRAPSDRFVKHALLVSELYIELMERARLGQFTLGAFQVEAAGYWPNGLGGWVKTDAFVKLHAGVVTDYWWYEADRGTEDVETTIRRKLLVYLDFIGRGQLGPDGIVPRVVIGTSTGKRRAEIQTVVDELPVPAAAMFVVTTTDEVASVMLGELIKG